MDRRNLEFGLLMPCLLYSPLPRAASARHRRGKQLKLGRARGEHIHLSPGTRIIHVQRSHTHARLRVENQTPERLCGGRVYMAERGVCNVRTTT